MDSTRATYDKLKNLLEEATSVKEISALLEWDQLVMMPPNAANARAKQMSALAGVIHDKNTNPEIGNSLDALEKSDLSALTEWERAVIRDARRNYNKATKIPKELAQKEAMLSSVGQDTWVTARKENDFPKFAPILKDWIALRKEIAKCIDPSKNPYDIMLDDFERGLSSERLNEIFSQVKERLVPLIEKIKANPLPDTSFLEHKFEVDKQVSLNHQIAKDLGFDMSSGRLDVSVHPFTTEVSPFDVRMTTRYKETDIVEGITGTIHETGHSLYEQGRPKEYAGLPVSQALSMGIHESQSLLWERMIGLSEPFWDAYWPKVKETFPQIPSNTTADQFYRAINLVKPSFIRVEADEVTYPMHIILRFELEKGLFDGSIQVDDLPRLWNEKMNQYLGIVPKTDAEGVLQDTHWAAGLFGYFPTYLLGAIYASQFFKQAEKELPNLRADIKGKNFKPLKEWLNTKIHSKGSLIPSGDLLTKDVTGSPLDPTVFLDHLYGKYVKLYKL